MKYFYNTKYLTCNTSVNYHHYYYYIVLFVSYIVRYYYIIIIIYWVFIQLLKTLPCRRRALPARRRRHYLGSDSSTLVGSDDCLHDGVRRWYVFTYFLFPRNHGPVRPSLGQVQRSKSLSNDDRSLFISFLTTENATEERTEASTPAQPVANAVSETTHVSEVHNLETAAAGPHGDISLELRLPRR